MGQRLKGKNAMVTGAGRGIGRAIALALAEEGANIVVCDFGGEANGRTGASKAPADAVVEECKRLGVKAVPNYGDVSNFKDAESMIKTCVDNFGRIDILCNIAGNFNLNMIFDMTEEQWDAIIAVHLKGNFNLIRHATPLMKEQRYGRIINCSSHEYAGLGLGIGLAHYGAAKGGIVSLTYAVAREMGKYGVTCNAITPGGNTRLAQELGIEASKRGFLSKEIIAASQKRGIKALSDPSYYAAFVAYLASDAAANINGCVFSTTKIGIWNHPEVVREFIRDPEKQDRWSLEEIETLMPRLLVGYINPSPPQPESE